jgi:hypothetical protein
MCIAYTNNDYDKQSSMAQWPKVKNDNIIKNVTPKYSLTENRTNI